MNLARYTRWQAAPLHLLLSAVVAGVVFFTMLFLWYPRPYFAAAGGATLLVLLIGVDVVLGPLLTLILFDPKKKYMMLDLAIIAILQVAALAYGGSIMFAARPAYVAFAGDRFELVAANEISPEDLDQAPADYRALPLTGPRIVGTKLPVDPRGRQNLMAAAMVGGSIGVFPQHYVPYDSMAHDAIAKSQPLSTLKERHPDRAGDIDALVAASGKPQASLRYLPLQSRRVNMTVIVDGVTGQVVSVSNIDPW